MKAKQKSIETGKRKTHAETPLAEADGMRQTYLSKPYLEREELTLNSVLLMRPCVIMCKDLESKAKQKSLETGKRKTHAETPQAEADAERHAYLCGSG
ncbi:hypothetical protein PoB_004408500 [Plakobranchus ocellatus]|uniref:Uncharacterized protein n=1 Tax=Plakobranchus ocellatus TaxID=259542 RepID=A0AAV4BEN4_9GAST|nr:hypothetical protein PoB_004408500 [Plakobranchus ocellatus]